MIVKKYRQKNQVIEAMIYEPKFITDTLNFLGEFGNVDSKRNLVVETLYGFAKALPGDYIVKNPQGDYFPVKKEKFEQAYEEFENSGFGLPDLEFD